MHYTEIDLYNIFYRIVRGWPPTYAPGTGEELTYNRINCFAVIDDENDLASDNLGKDSRYKPTIGGELFFSRIWEANGFIDETLQQDFPMLLLWEEPGQTNGTQSVERIRYRGGIYDKYAAAFDPGTFGAGDGRQRTKEEIKNGLRNLRTQLTLELAKWEKMETKTGGDPWQVGLFNKDYLETLIPDIISEYRNDVPLTAVLDMSQMQTATASDIDVAGLVASYFSFTFERSCATPVVIDHAKNYLTATPATQPDHPLQSSA